MKNILYIIMSDLDLSNVNSGPTVRSSAILNGFEKLGSNIDTVYGPHPRGRYASFKKVLKNGKKYDYCYIESKVGVTRYYDSLLLLLLKLKLKPKKIGFYYRDMYWKYGIRMSTGKTKNYFVPLVNKIYLKFIDNVCDVVYGQSESFCKSLSEHIIKSHVKILPPGCDDICVKNLKANEVFYVGEIDPHFSGVELLIEALEIANKKKRVILNLVCRKHEYQQNSYLNKMARKHNWLNISHHNKSDIYEVYNRSSVTIIPRSNNEYTKLCLPIKLFEYISYEKPIVAINHGETAKFIKENQLGIISDNSPEDLASDILNLLDDTEVYERLKSNIQKYKKHNLWVDRVKYVEESLS